MGILYPNRRSFLDGVTIKKTFINLEKQLNTKEIDLWKEGAIRYNICEFKVQKKYNKQEAPINIETNKAISFINNQFDAQIDFLYIHYKDTLIKYPIK